MQKEFKEIGTKSPLIFIGDILQKLLDAAYAIIIGRLLGADIYGQFVFVTAILFILAVIPKLGMANGIINYLSRNNLSDQIKRTTLTFSLVISFLISLLFIVIIYFNMSQFRIAFLKNQEFYIIFSIMLPSLIIFTSKELIESYFRGKRRIKEIIIINNFFMPISRIVLIIVLYFAFNISNYLCLVIPYYISSSISIGCLLYIIVRDKGIGNIFHKSFSRITYLKFTLPLLLSGIVYILTENTDRYMLGIMRGAVSVGIYRIAFLFGGVSSLGLFAINKIFSPMISNLYYNNEIQKLKDLYKVTAKWSYIISALVLGVIAINSKEIMLLAGEEFVLGSSAALIIAIGQLVNSGVGSVALMNMMTGNTKAPLLGAICGLTANILLNLLLIKDYGMNGAAIATAASLIITNVLNLFFVYKRFHVVPFDISFMKIILFLVGLVLLINRLATIVELNFIIKLIITSLVFISLFSFVVIKFILSKAETTMILNIIRKTKKK